MAMRIVWLDSLKGLGIFLVIFGHLLPASVLTQYVYAFHVPLFFVVSGYLFDRRRYGFRQLVLRRLRTLIVPYFVFATVSFLFWFVVVRGLSVGGRALEANPLKPFVGIFYGVGDDEWSVPLNVALW